MTERYRVYGHFDAWGVLDKGAILVRDLSSEDDARRIAAALNHAAAVPELVEALKPFAEQWKWIKDVDWDELESSTIDELIFRFCGAKTSLTAGDCRRAAAAVEKWEAGK